MNSLPGEFAALESFVEKWAHGTELRRSQTRWSASKQDYEAFYLAMLPRLDDILAHLDHYEVGSIPEESLTLYHLVLAFAEAAPHNELYDCASEVPNSFSASRFIAAHGDQVDR